MMNIKIRIDIFKTIKTIRFNKSNNLQTMKFNNKTNLKIKVSANGAKLKMHLKMKVIKTQIKNGAQARIPKEIEQKESKIKIKQSYKNL